MKKKTILCTTIAGTMFVAGLTMPGVRATVGENAKAIISEKTSSAYIELDTNSDVLTREDLKKLVNEKYNEYGVTVVKIAGEDLTDENKTLAVGTGAQVSLSNKTELTLVVYGDVDGDGDVDLDDSTDILYHYAGEKTITDEAKLKAADVTASGDTETEKITLDDSTQVLYFYAGEGKLVEDGKKIEETIYASIGAKITKQDNKKAESGLWAVEPNETNTEVTLKVEGAKTAENNTKVSFELTNLKEGTTIEGGSTDGVTLEAITDGKATVKVPKKVGEYTFTLKAEEGKQKITAKVVDVTLPTKTAVTFEEIQEEDVKAITEEKLLANTEDVYSKDNKPTSWSADMTFKGNVNNMKEYEEDVNEQKMAGKYYKVRIKVEGYDNTNLVAVNKDTLREYPTEAVEGAPNTVYVLLDANEATTNLVMKVKDAVNAQVEAVQEKAANKVTFESTSKMQIKTISSDTNNSENDNKTAVKISRPDSANKNYAVLGTYFNKLKEVYLDTTDFKTPAQQDDKIVSGKWESIYVQLSDDNLIDALSKTVTLEDTNNDILLDKITKNNKDTGTVIRLWVNLGDTEETKTCKLVYHETTNYEEKLTLTLDIKDASVPEILTASIGNVETDPNSKGVVVATKSEKGAGNGSVKPTSYTVNVDTYKYAMDPTITREAKIDKDTTQEVTGRWYSVILETNVPVKNLVFNNNWGTSGSPIWTEFPQENIIDDNHVIIWLNRDTVAAKSPVSVEQTIANKYALTSMTDNKTKEQVGVNIKQTEKSVTEFIGNKTPIWASSINTNPTVGTLATVGVKENVHDAELSNLEDTLATTEKAKHTLKNNATKSASVTVTNEYDSKLDKYTGTVKLNTRDFGDIEVNGTVGQWALLHFAVRGDINKIVDENEDHGTVYVDVTNASELLRSTTVNDYEDATWYRVPVWVNLSSKPVEEAIANKTAIEVTFGTQAPIEEHNSFMLKFEDTNPNTEELTAENAAPQLFGEELTSKLTSKTPQTELQSFFVNDKTQPFCTDKNKAKALLQNIEKLQTAEKSYKYVEDTVYVNIKDDFTTYADEDNRSTMRVALKLNLTTLGVKKDQNMCFYNDGTGKWIDTKADCDNGIYFTIKLNGNDYKQLKTHKKTLTKEYIFAVGAMTASVTAGNTDHRNDADKCSCIKKGVKYIRYVFTFTPEA